MDRPTWRDRMIDTLLSEELSAEEFPDLTSSIMERWNEELETQHADSKQALIKQHKQEETHSGVLAKLGSRWKWSAAIAAIVVIGLGVGLLFNLPKIETYPDAELTGGLKIASMESGQGLQRDQILKTDDQSGGLKLGGYAEVEVAAHSEIRWQGAPNAEVVELRKGSVVNRVDKERDGTFEVITPYGRVQTVGTVFEVRLVEGSEADMKLNPMVVKVLFGSVLVTGSFGQEIVQAGDEKSFGEPSVKQADITSKPDSGKQLNSNKASQPKQAQAEVEKRSPKALQRLGTVKFNPVKSYYKDMTHFSISPDQKIMASANLSEFINIWELETGKLIKQVDVGSFLRELKFSADGQYLAVNIVRGDVVVYRVKDWKQIARIPRKLTGNVTDFTFSPDNQQLAACTSNGFIHILDIESNQLIQKIKGYRKSEPIPNGRGTKSHVLSSVSYRSDGKALVVACLDKHLRIFDTETWKLQQSIQRDIHGLNSAQYYDQDRKLIWAENALSPMGATTSIYSYDFDTETVTTIVESSDPSIYDLRVSPDGSQLAMLDILGRIRVLDLSSLETLYQEEDSVTKIVKQRVGLRDDFVKGLCFAYAGDGKRIYASAEFTVIPRVVDTQTWKEIYPYNAHIWKIDRLTFNQAQNQLISRDVSGLTQTWDLESSQAISHEKIRIGSKYLHHSNDGKLSIKVDEMNRNTSFEVVDRQSKETKFSFVYKGLMLTHEFSPDGKHLAVSTRDVGHVFWFYLLDTDTGKVIYEQAFQDAYQYNFGAHGQLLAIAGRHDRRVYEDSIYVFDLKDKARVIFAKHIPVHKGMHVLLSPDGFMLGYQGNGTKGLILWDLVTGNEIGKLDGFVDWGLPNKVAFDHMSGQIAVSNVGKVWLYDAYTRGEIHHYAKTDGHLTTLNFSPDGKYLATAHDAGTILVWDAGRLPIELEEKPKSLEELWASAIDKTDLKESYRSIGKLVDRGDESVAFLRKAFEGHESQDNDQVVEQIVKDLGTGDDELRGAALKRLNALGADARASIEKAHENAPNLDIRLLLETWLKGLNEITEDSRVTEEKRAIQILEAIRTKQAIAVLEAWSKSENASALKIQALAAMERIHSKP